MKQIHLTPIKVSFPFDAPTRIVRKELVANKVNFLLIRVVFLLLG
jgi:hypothetical protein